MKKTFWFFMVVFIAGLFTVSADPIANDGGRPLGAEGIPMPDWVRSPPDTDDTIFFIGESFYGATAAGRKESASLSGLIAFADFKGSTFTTRLREISSKSGEIENAQLLETEATAHSKANTAGFMEVASWIAADGRYFGLYSYPKNNLLEEIKSAE